VPLAEPASLPCRPPCCLSFAAAVLLLSYRWGSEKKSEEDSAEGAAGAAAGSGASGSGDGSDAAGSNALVPNSAEHMHRKVRMRRQKQRHAVLSDNGMRASCLQAWVWQEHLYSALCDWQLCWESSPPAAEWLARQTYVHSCSQHMRTHM
jgi:hypothetical protein